MTISKETFSKEMKAFNNLIVILDEKNDTQLKNKVFAKITKFNIDMKDVQKLTVTKSKVINMLYKEAIDIHIRDTKVKSHLLCVLHAIKNENLRKIS